MKPQSVTITKVLVMLIKTRLFKSKAIDITMAL